MAAPKKGMSSGSSPRKVGRMPAAPPVQRAQRAPTRPKPPPKSGGPGQRRAV